VSLTLVLAVWAVTECPAHAQKNRAEAIADKIEQERKTLEQLKDKIEETRKHADEAGKKRESVLQAIQSLDQRLADLRQQHQETTRKLRKKDREIEQITDQIATIKQRIEQRKTAILARLRTQYIEGRFGDLKVLLASASYGDFQRRFQYLSAVSQHEYAIVEAYRSDATRLEGAERQREEARAGMLAYRESTEKRLKEIKVVQKEKRVVLTKITQEKESFERAVDEMERSATRLDSLLKELEQRRRALAARPPAGAMLPKGVKGTLPWPTDGKVVSFFGRQKHPTFNTYIQRKGIEIRTPEGSTIRAVMPGTVVYADWLKGYGLVIIMDHANGYFSLYAHASKILTTVGERIEPGQTIGETGDTGMIGENTLYFELREGAEAVDPLTWLAKR
jgi:septal ring factor EnvC (AmiA/AmiB activator)